MKEKSIANVYSGWSLIDIQNDEGRELRVPSINDLSSSDIKWRALATPTRLLDFLDGTAERSTSTLDIGHSCRGSCQYGSSSRLPFGINLKPIALDVKPVCTGCSSLPLFLMTGISNTCTRLSWRKDPFLNVKPRTPSGPARSKSPVHCTNTHGILYK